MLCIYYFLIKGKEFLGQPNTLCAFHSLLRLQISHKCINMHSLSMRLFVFRDLLFHWMDLAGLGISTWEVNEMFGD